jgi:WD40 repeat protein
MHMKTYSKLLALMLLSVSGSRIHAEAALLAPGEKEPLLRLEAGGPTSYVSALAFSTDGVLLYAAGWDKVVRVWRRDARGTFAQEQTAYRVPLGPGLAGAINALALSEDGTWLAVGGLGVFRGAAGFRQRGWIWPSDGALTPGMRQDQGIIYVFNTKTQAVRLLRGHEGPVLGLAFAPQRQGKPPLLVSAAGEWDAEAGHFMAGIRLWDVESSTYRDGTYLDKLWQSDADIARPGLAVWHTGDRWQQLQVAIAWDDGVFRVWDLERARDRVSKIKDPKYTNTAAYAAGLGHVITAAYGTGKARLRMWNLRPGEQAQADLFPPLPAQQVDCFPRALALVSSLANGNLDYAAAIVRVPHANRSEYRLQLLDLGGENVGAVAAEQTLWSGEPKQPVLAAAPRSSYLAVAGNEGHDIQVYSIQDLLKRNKGPHQRLRSTGTAFRFAAFVSKGKDLGILLNETAGKTPGQPPRAPESADLIFDLTQRRLTADRTGWEISIPDLNGWRTEQKMEKERSIISIFHADRRVQEIRLKASQTLSDFALLPTPAGLNVPILAIASHQGGQPILCLYNAATGEQVRHLTGHQGPIRCIAFSADGRFLVSVAEDQTVCVWSLTNLVKLVGHYGQLLGIAVKEGNGTLLVSQVEDDSPARQVLEKGDIIEGLVEGSRVRPLKSLKDYTEAVVLTKPGQTVLFDVRGRRGPRRVKLEVGQGIDERKPLLSLFIAREGKPEEREWVGWNPIGPYEASNRKAERRLGWHFNTGKAESPTRFAFAQEYRNQYYREGLLKELIARGEFQRVPPAPALPPPEVGLLIEDEGTYPNADGHGQILVRHSQVALKLTIGRRPLNSLESLTWMLADQEAQKLNLEQAPENEIAVPLRLQRGVHKVSVIARTPESGGQNFVEELTLRYQPLPPRVQWKGPKSLIVRDPAFELNAVIHPALTGEDVQVIFAQRHNNEFIVQEKNAYSIDARQPLAFTKKLTLRPGNNLIEIVAQNRNALHGHEEVETARLALEVTRVQKSPPPLIALDSVLPGEGGKGKQDLAIEPGKIVQVQVERIIIRGTIDAAEGEKLVKAEWMKGSLPPATELADFRPGKDTKLPINVNLTLQPGPQTIRFRAKTAGSDEAEKSITVYYQPPLPPVEVVSPQPGDIRYGAKETEEIVLQARLGRSDHPHNLQAKILLGGKEVTNSPVVFDQEARGLRGRIVLHPGRNRIQLQLSNPWGAVSTTDDMNISYLRPPQVLELNAPRESKEPFLDLNARVRSALPLLLNSVVVEVNGKRRDVQPSLAEPFAGDGSQVVRLKNVPLDADTEANEVSVRLSNREAECFIPATAKILYRPVKAPPVVDFVQPRENLVVHLAKLNVHFQVRSGGPLKKVQLIQEGDQPLPVDLSKVRPNPDGSHSLNTELAVQLRHGLNTLRVVAANDGGEQEAALIVNFPYKPVRLVIDSLSPIGSGDKPVPAAVQPGGTVTFSAIPYGRVRLEGHVAWDEEDDARLKQAKIVRVFVNGFQQLPVRLESGTGDGRERPFRTDILLNQAVGNRVEISLQGLEQDAASRSEFLVDCKNPIRAQRLHLFLVSLDDGDAKGLESQFVKVLAPAFEGVDLYGPLAGYYARPRNVRQQLRIIRDQIQSSANKGLPSIHIVVFYYQGGEAVDAQGNFFQASANVSNDECGPASITCDELVQFFAETPGAHVLLFDVDRQRAKNSGVKDKLADWNYPDVESHVAVLRYAWLSGKDQPKEPRLVEALQEALPHAIRLVEVTDQLSQLASRSRYFPDFLRVDKHVSEEMKNLLLSKQP